jgi:hypothetical protein
LIARRLRVGALSLAFALTASASAERSPAQTDGESRNAVTLIVHVPLAVPDLSHAPADAQCDGDTRTYPARPLPVALMQRDEAALRAFGTLDDRYGFGTWTAPGTHGATLLRFEDDDHVIVHARPSALARALRPLLRRMRAEMHQQEMLAEIVGDSDGSLGKKAVLVAVTLPRGRATYANVTRLHRIFADGGDGGASQFDAPAGVDIYSDVAPSAVARISRNIRRAGFPYTTEPITVVEIDAPPCASR